MSEWYMRATTGLAALRAVAEGKVVNKKILDANGWVKGQPVDLNVPENYAKAADFASNIVSQAFGDYTKYNKPALIRKSPLLKTMYTFRFYNQHLMEMWNHYLRGNAGSRGQVAAIASMTMQGLLGGMKSMPIAAAIMAMYKAYANEDVETLTREAFPDNQLALDAAFEGMPSLLGVTIGSSLDVGFPSSVKEAIGIPAAVVDDAVKLYQAWAAGNTGKALEYMSPLLAIRDVLSGLRESSYGQRTLGGRPIAAPGEIEPQTLTNYQALVKALGFQPTEREKLGRLRESMGRLEDLKKTTQTQYADRYTNAVIEANYDKAASILNEIIAWNITCGAGGKPELMISNQDLNIAIETRMSPKQPSTQMLGRGLQMKEAYGLGQ
jgi:hypothetical protein